MHNVISLVVIFRFCRIVNQLGLLQAAAALPNLDRLQIGALMVSTQTDPHGMHANLA